MSTSNLSLHGRPDCHSNISARVSGLESLITWPRTSQIQDLGPEEGKSKFSCPNSIYVGKDYEEPELVVFSQNWEEMAGTGGSQTAKSEAKTQHPSRLYGSRNNQVWQLFKTLLQQSLGERGGRRGTLEQVSCYAQAGSLD